MSVFFSKCFLKQNKWSSKRRCTVVDEGIFSKIVNRPGVARVTIQTGSYFVEPLSAHRYHILTTKNISYGRQRFSKKTLTFLFEDTGLGVCGPQGPVTHNIF